jgi:transcription elongation GreA/GreB family factor
MDSPLARALMGQRRDAEVTVEVPGGSRSFLITEVRYDPDAEGTR